MCLNTITKGKQKIIDNLPRDSKNLITGYKIFGLTAGQLRGDHKIYEYKIGRNDAQIKVLNTQWDEHGCTYKSGFHCFLTLTDARLWHGLVAKHWGSGGKGHIKRGGILIPIQFYKSWATTVGTQECHKGFMSTNIINMSIIVCKSIIIPENWKELIIKS